MNVSKKLLLLSLLSTTIPISNTLLGHLTTPSDAVEIITTADDLHTALISQTPAAIMLSMDNCPHCNIAKPHFITAAQNKAYRKTSFYIANGQKLQAAQAINKLGGPVIPGYPSIVYVSRGKIVDHQIGGNKKTVDEKLTKLNKLH